MGKIKLLSQETRAQIAAGEVIERPASVVKELIENSLDAQSKNIRIEIKESGLRMIKVVDDGEGMEPEDAELSIQHHATSKISTWDDLFSLSSLGFRGEALASIVRCSECELITRAQGKEIGVRLKISDGKIQEKMEVGSPEGTRITVNNLFYNLPARKKFLKSPSTELFHIVRVVENYAVCYPEVHFKLLHHNRILLELPRSKRLKERVFLTFKEYKPDDFLELSFSKGEYKLEGFITKPEKTFPRGKLQLFFVNRRPVVSKLLSQSVYSGAKEFFPKAQSPAFILFLKLPPREVDCNVHPTKREIKFRQEDEIYHFLTSSLKKLFREALPRDAVLGRPKSLLREPVTVREKREEPQASSLEFFSTDELVEASFGEQFFFQVKASYVITATQDELMIIDQHAASERILYQKLQKEYQEEGKVKTHSLLFPELIEVSLSESLALTEQLEEIQKLGFEVEPFGKGTFLIKGAPLSLQDISLKDLFQEFASITLDDKEELLKKLLTVTACKGAIKANQHLHPEEMASLVKELLSLENPYTCPHGRPTMLRFSFSELEKKFKRR
jgi:DNA mismatch repair protein MutL